MIPPGDVPLDRPFLRATAHRSDAAAGTSRGGGAGARMRRRELCGATRADGCGSADGGAIYTRWRDRARAGGPDGGKRRAGARARGGVLSHPEIFEFQDVIKIKNKTKIFS